MDRETAKQEIRRSWKMLFPADGKGKGIVCPLCGSGSGHNGTGISENPKKAGQLTCWDCGFKGDVIDLIQQRDGSDYNTALQTAADALGITIDPYTDRTAKKAVEAPQNALTRVNEQKHDAGMKTPGNCAQQPTAARIADYSQYYAECMERLFDPAAILYLQARGISTGTAMQCNIGFDPEWISPTVVKSQKAKGNSWTPAATARIIMPVSNNHYVARAIDPAVKDYAKMNETGGGNVGIFNSRILKEDLETIFVTEGIFDALSIIEVGAAAIALNSTNNADKLIKALEEQPTRATLILCLDSDAAGSRATAQLKQGLTRLNISYIDANISGNYKDPNEALTGNRDAFIKAIQTAQQQASTKPDNVSTYIDNLMQGEIEKLQDASDCKTGFDQLDEKSGGLYPGLYVIAATSSLGKTTFALQMADNLAAAGHDVLFFSMEQSRLELVSKSFSRILLQEEETKISSLDLRKGLYPDKLQRAAGIYKEKIADRLSIIEGNFNCNISFIGDYIRRYIRNNGSSPIVIIDYLQILQPAEDQKVNSVKETVDHTVTELKRISREHDLTVFIISSVNRANYLTPIDFEALKESGGIEYTADVIWGLQLQCLNDPLFEQQNKIKEKRQKIRQEKAAKPRKIELLCLKNRYGISYFSCDFDYDPEHDLFVQTKYESGFNPYTGNDPFTSSSGKTISASF